MIYDSDQNLTWLQDANYARTSGHDSDGRMTWENAMSWASNLTYGGYNDWRLPYVNDNGDGCIPAFSGTYCGFNTDTRVSCGCRYTSNQEIPGEFAYRDALPVWRLLRKRFR
ncbi:MAG: DUF1566 domain-containing protein [Candidatus Thiodiazotropha sp.]